MNQQNSALQHGYFPTNTDVERTISPLQMQSQSNISIATVNVSAQFFRSLSDAFMRTRNQAVTTMVNWNFNQFSFDWPVDIVLIDPDGSWNNFADFLAKLSARPRTRIIILSEDRATEQIVNYYAHGVDDYIIKPCTHQEIALRIAALIRRQTWSTARPQLPRLCMDGVITDNRAYEVGSSDYLIRLSPIEFQLLNVFMRKPNEPINAEKLFRQVWGYEVHGYQKLLDLAIRHLRQKVESAQSPPGQIYAIDNAHYQFCPSEPTKSLSHSPMLVHT